MWLFHFQIFLNYNHSKQEENHSIIQQVYPYQVIHSIKFQIDVPFTNGEFNSMLFRDKNVDDIECDESIIVNK